MSQHAFTYELIPMLLFLKVHYIVLHIKMHVFTWKVARIHTSYTESLASFLFIARWFSDKIMPYIGAQFHQICSLNPTLCRRTHHVCWFNPSCLVNSGLCCEKKTLLFVDWIPLFGLLNHHESQFMSIKYAWLLGICRHVPIFPAVEVNSPASPMDLPYSVKAQKAFLDLLAKSSSTCWGPHW